MANNNLTAEIRSRIEAFVSDLSEAVKMAALGSVSMALGGEAGATRRRGPGRPRGSGRRTASANGRRKRGKRSSGDVEAASQKVLAHVKANPGQRLEEIGRALKRPTSVLKRPVANLMAAKQLKTKGQKRGTKYFVR